MGHYTTLYQKDYAWPPKRKYPPRIGVSGPDANDYVGHQIQRTDRCCCCLQKLPTQAIKVKSYEDCEKLKDAIKKGERCCCCLQKLDHSPIRTCSHYEGSEGKTGRDERCRCCQQKLPSEADRKKLSSMKDDAKVRDEIKKGERCCCCLQKLKDSPSSKSKECTHVKKGSEGSDRCRCCLQKLPSEAERKKLSSKKDDAKVKDEIKKGDRCCCCLQKIDHSSSDECSKIEKEIKHGERCCCCLQKLPPRGDRCSCCSQILPHEADRLKSLSKSWKKQDDEGLKLHVCKTGPRPETEITEFNQPHEFLKKLHEKHPDLYRILHPLPKDRPLKRMKVDGMRTTYQVDYDHLDYFVAPDEQKRPNRLDCPPTKKLEIICEIQDRPRLNKDMGKPKEESSLKDDPKAKFADKEDGEGGIGRPLPPWITEYQEIIDRTGAAIIKDKLHGTSSKGNRTLGDIWTPCRFVSPTE